MFILCFAPFLWAFGGLLDFHLLSFCFFCSGFCLVERLDPEVHGFQKLEDSRRVCFGAVQQCMRCISFVKSCALGMEGPMCCQNVSGCVHSFHYPLQRNCACVCEAWCCSMDRFFLLCLALVSPSSAFFFTLTLSAISTVAHKCSLASLRCGTVPPHMAPRETKQKLDFSCRK